ncbi:hypothetical protein SLS57_008221 [Botryosphaeria dothidea]
MFTQLPLRSFALTIRRLAYQSTGVIYGDIGTSPLYVYSSTFSSEPTRDDLLGALSLIIWAITLVVTVKYVLIVLSANDEGEELQCNISKQDPKKSSSYRLSRWQTHELRAGNRKVRDLLENSHAMHGILKALSVFGVSLILADSILTPAQSVLGAVQGLKVVREDLGTDVIVGVSCAIIVLLFALQPLGISRLASCFAPVVVVWLLLNFCYGVYNIAVYDTSVLKAFSPYFAGQFFVRNKTDGWLSLGGILLAFTGVEALFADLGAFSQRAIQLSWLCLAYPCLLFAYIGQAAYISENEGAYSNPFFESVPPGMFYPSLVISILAAIVASQALITSAFQLLTQVMNTSYFPQIKTVYTSDKFHGQVYIPFANWLMMIGTVIVTAVYNNTTKLGHAYGFCVVLVTFITTCLVALVALIVWRVQWWLVLPVWFIFITLDGLGIFFDKAGTKLPTVYEEFLRKFQAQQDVHVFLHLRALPVPHVAEAEAFEVAGTRQPNCYRMIIRHGYNDHPVSADLGAVVYKQLREAICKAPVVKPIRQPASSADATTTGTTSTSVTNADPADDYDAINIASGPSESTSQEEKSSKAPSTNLPTVSERLAALDSAFSTQVVYIVGKEQLRLLQGSNNVFKRTVLEIFLWFRDNTRAKVSKMNIPVDKLVEVGFVREI